jgi:hypothetical protein
MNIVILVAAIAGVMLAFELAFFLFCFRWLASGKRAREKEFARLDDERAELLRLQSLLKQDMVETKALADDTLKKLRVLGADAHSEWMEMRECVQTLTQEFDSSAKRITDENVAQLVKQRLTLEKAGKEGREQEIRLGERMREVERALRFLDKSTPVDQIQRDLQKEKYAEAKSMLDKGIDPAAISRRLGISINELALLSHCR